MDVLGSLFSRSVDLMGKTLGLRLAKHAHIAGNLANIDTPKYKVKDLDFQKALEKALPKPEGSMRMRQTHRKHMPAQDINRAYDAARQNVVYSVYGKDEKGDDVLDIDQEMTKLVKNQLMYNATVQMLAKKFENLKYAISEGGR